MLVWVGPVVDFIKLKFVLKMEGVIEIHFKVNLSPKEYYPFGKNGNVTYKGCSKKYPFIVA